LTHWEVGELEGLRVRHAGTSPGLLAGTIPSPPTKERSSLREQLHRTSPLALDR